MDRTIRPDSYVRLAPDVDRDWVEDFVLEQRLLGVPGEKIGDALAVVQSHVAESGESALDAFGSPRDYARELGSGARVLDVRNAGWILGSLLGLVGLLLTSAGADAWLFGDGSLQVTLGLAVAALAAVAACLVLVAKAEPFLRVVVDRPWVAVAGVTLWTLLMAGAVALLRAPLVGVPAAAVTAAGVVLLVVSTALEWRTMTQGTLEDPILGPGESAAGRRRGWLAWATVFMFPAFAVLLLGLSWVLDALA